SAPEEILPSAWAEKYRRLSAETSKEQGTWRNDRAPFMVEPMDCLAPQDPCEFVIVQKPVQVAASESMNNGIGYVAHILRKSMLLVQPTIEVMETYSDLRIQTMIRDTPVLAERVSENSRDETNKKLLKMFPGGFLKMAGANSPASLRSLPLGYLFCDEVDAWPLDCGGEGAPLDLALKRTDTFADRKVWLSSTPVEKETPQRYR
ncbi:MAG: phage terminase large subunit family protein, partial [Deltaproteobacteria bacterium]|nr:phage terminase large subunit family protein [Deltaproteobacteria bacterium]